MRILFLSSVFPRPGDPTRGTVCFNTCERLADDHDVRVVSPRPWHARPRDSSAPAAAGLRAEYPRYFYPPGSFRGSHGACMWWSSRRAARRAAGAPGPDCVLSYWAYPDGEAALRAARSFGAASALIVGGSDVLLLDGHPARRRFVDVLRATDLLLPVSRDLADRLVGLGVSPGRVRVAYQGVDKDRFRVGDRGEARSRLGLGPGGPVLLWVGRMVPVKGLDVLLRAAALLRARGGVSPRLCLVGDGPLRPSLEARARSLGLADSVRFAGAVAPEGLADWYRASDLVVLPSLSEGIPNVLREGLACGRPFVASRVGGVAELADPSCRLVAPGSPDELAEAIAGVIAEPADPEALSARAPNPTWADYARDVAGAIGECVDRRRRPTAAS